MCLFFATQKNLYIQKSMCIIYMHKKYNNYKKNFKCQIFYGTGKNLRIHMDYHNNFRVKKVHKEKD